MCKTALQKQIHVISQICSFSHIQHILVLLQKSKQKEFSYINSCRSFRGQNEKKELFPISTSQQHGSRSIIPCTHWIPAFPLDYLRRAGWERGSFLCPPFFGIRLSSWMAPQWRAVFQSAWHTCSPHWKKTGRKRNPNDQEQGRTEVLETVLHL